MTADIKIIDFNAEDMLTMTGELSAEQKQILLNYAQLNQVAGPGCTVLLDGKPICSGGVRIYGIGEAWAYFSKDITGVLLQHRITILKVYLEYLEKMQRDNKLWKIWAETNKDSFIDNGDQMRREDFLRFMGFKRHENAFVK
jgi:hypothetical protein